MATSIFAGLFFFGPPVTMPLAVVFIALRQARRRASSLFDQADLENFAHRIGVRHGSLDGRAIELSHATLAGHHALKIEITGPFSQKLRLRQLPLPLIHDRAEPVPTGDLVSLGEVGSIGAVEALRALSLKDSSGAIRALGEDRPY